MALAVVQRLQQLAETSLAAWGSLRPLLHRCGRFHARATIRSQAGGRTQYLARPGQRVLAMQVELASPHAWAWVRDRFEPLLIECCRCFVQGNPGGPMAPGRALDSRAAPGNPLVTMGGAPPGVAQMQRPQSTGAIGGSINGPRVLPGPAMGAYAGAPPAVGMGAAGFPPRPGAGMLQYGGGGGVGGGGGGGGGGGPQQGDLLALLTNKAAQQGGGGYGSVASLSGAGSMGSMGGLLLQGEGDSAPFDPSEFPSLSISRPGSGSGSGLQLDPLEASYGAAALGHKHPSEFSIQNEDFPALPGALKALQQAQSAQGAALRAAGGGPPEGHLAGAHLRAGPAGASGMAGKGLSGGSSKSPSAGDRGERFGLLGLLNVIRMSDVDLSTLALGTDLTTLGLNLNQSDMLYKTFTSPWAEGPGRPEPELPLPACYFQQAPRLIPAIFTKFSMESLFYVFYSSAGEEPQRLAADELLSRGWCGGFRHTSGGRGCTAPFLSCFEQA